MSRLETVPMKGAFAFGEQLANPTEGFGLVRVTRFVAIEQFEKVLAIHIASLAERAPQAIA